MDKKQEIKRLYLEGMSIKEIGEKFGIKKRAIYYHLGSLTKEEKLVHLQRSLDRPKNDNQTT